LQTQLVLVKRQILEADRRILAWHRSNELSRRLEAIPGVGPLIATALVASIPNPHAFGSARDVSAWIGLAPKQHSTGGKQRRGSISKAGNRYLRSTARGRSVISDPASQAGRRLVAEAVGRAIKGRVDRAVRLDLLAADKALRTHVVELAGHSQSGRG
jgi:transposase